MKQFFFFLMSLCALLPLRLSAQNPTNTIAIPNPSFENWSTGEGYEVEALVYLTLPVYEDFTYPTGWNYPSYPVNEDFSYSSLTINVNTNLPLMKITDENSSVVDGSHAIKMQSFMLSDIINSTVYNLAQSSLDESLTTSVFPTVLSTGVVDIDEFLPMMYTITSSLGSLYQLMMAFSDVDVNSVINGGIALNGAIPDKLTGYYKYTSAGDGDNGGIMILGTKYNPTTNKREVVGGGYTTALTDTSVYTRFEVTYSPLSEIYPSAPYEEADSLIVFLFSSANSEPQQGSVLYLDNLQLSAQEEIIPEDTCSAVFDLHVIEVDTTHATIGWSFDGDPNHFEAEYGIHGFTPGSGTLVNVSESFVYLSNLLPDTEYDIYVRCGCLNDLWGEWSMISFHTDTLPIDHTGIQNFTEDNLQVYPNPAQGQCILQFNGELPKMVRLFSIDGALLLEMVPDKETFEFTLPASGVFILSCEMREGIVNRKIVNR